MLNEFNELYKNMVFLQKNNSAGCFKNWKENYKCKSYSMTEKEKSWIKYTSQNSNLEIDEIY